MKPGPRPTPVPLRLVRGNPGRRPLPKAASPSSTSPRPPRYPPHLSRAAKTEWLRVTRYLARLPGMLDQLDRAILAGYCQAYARWADAERELVATGGAVVKSPGGYPIQNPWLAIANKAMDQYHKAAVEFGMSPSARASLIGSKPAASQPADPAQELQDYLRYGKPRAG